MKVKKIEFFSNIVARSQQMRISEHADGDRCVLWDKFATVRWISLPTIVGLVFIAGSDWHLMVEDFAFSRTGQTSFIARLTW